MIALLLICSIVCNSFASTRFNTSSRQLVCIQNPNSHAQPGTQLPEKVESEKDNKHENNFFFIELLVVFNPLKSSEIRRYSEFDAFSSRGNLSGVPLFLSKRSFLI